MRLTRRDVLAGVTGALAGVGVADGVASGAAEVASAGESETTMELLAEAQVDHEHACFHAEYSERTPLSATADVEEPPVVSDTHVIWEVTVPGATGHVSFDADSHFHDGPFAFYTAVGSAVPVTGTLVKQAAVSDADCPYLDEYVLVDPADGTITLELCPDDAPEPATFDVTLDATPEIVEAGTEAVVEYTVENTGEQAGTETVALLVDGTEIETHPEVTLDPGDSHADTFSYATDGDDLPEITITVATDETSRSATIAMTEPAALAVDIVDWPETVEAGTEAVVEYAVENAGKQPVTRTVALLVDGTEIEAHPEVTVDPGDRHTDSFVYPTTVEDVPEITVEVESEDTAATERVTVTEPPAPATFVTTILSHAQAVTAGDRVVVVYELENTGERAGSQDIDLLVDGERRETNPEVGLDPGEAATFSVDFPTTVDDIPERAFEIRSDDTTTSATVAIQEPEPASLTVAVDEREVAVESTAMFDLAATITNEGEQEATREVVLELEDGQMLASESVTLAGGETATIGFEDVEPPEPGEFVAVVATEDAEETVALVVSDPVTTLDLVVERRPGPGETVAFEVIATFASGETEDVTGGADVAVESGGIELDADDGTLEGIDPGPAEVTATVEGTTATTTVQVLQPARFGVQVRARELAVTVGDGVEFPVAVTNEGEQPGEATVTVEGEGFETTTWRPSLDPGAETTTVVALETTDPEPGPTTITAATADDTDELSVLVESADTGDDATDDGTSDAEMDAASEDVDDNQTTDTDEDTPADTADDDGSGFGVVAGIAGLGGLAHLLRARMRRQDRVPNATARGEPTHDEPTDATEHAEPIDTTTHDQTT